jgi:hypothetical protein
MHEGFVEIRACFHDKDGKLYPLDEATRQELVDGLEKIFMAVAKRLHR